MPTHNRLEYLRPAIASVFAQTAPDWELIIADDESNDETRSHLRTLVESSRVKILWRSHCGIPAVVRNAALAQATGTYVAFLDSDDEWMPQKLERQLIGLRTRPERRWSYTGSVIIDEGGARRPRTANQELPRPQGSILAALLANAVDIWTPTVLVERKLLMQLGGFDPRLVVFEDYDLWLRLSTQSDIDLVDEPLVCVRRHASHFTPGDPSIMPRSRDQSLRGVQALLEDPQLRRLVGRERARSALALVRARAETDRAGAIGSVLLGGGGAWRYRAWWAGLPPTLLKLALPSWLLRLHRRQRLQ
jgi:glycosyltransferase involved in cell wall biosynthesis